MQRELEGFCVIRAQNVGNKGHHKSCAHRTSTILHEGLKPWPRKKANQSLWAKGLKPSCTLVEVVYSIPSYTMSWAAPGKIYFYKNFDSFSIYFKLVWTCLFSKIIFRHCVNATNANTSALVTNAIQLIRWPRNAKMSLFLLFVSPKGPGKSTETIQRLVKYRNQFPHNITFFSLKRRQWD